jgi:hypothetical protein
MIVEQTVLELASLKSRIKLIKNFKIMTGFNTKLWGLKDGILGEYVLVSCKYS